MKFICLLWIIKATQGTAQCVVTATHYAIALLATWQLAPQELHCDPEVWVYIIHYVHPTPQAILPMWIREKHPIKGHVEVK